MWALNTFYAAKIAIYKTFQLSHGVITALTYEEICCFLTFLDKTMVLLVYAKNGVQSTA